MKYNRWHDTIIDTNLFLQLQDLTTVLSQVEKLQFEHTYGSFVDLYKNRMTGSTLSDATQPDIQKVAYKTDENLRAIGTLHHSQLPAFHKFRRSIANTNLLQFATQLITLLEDLRLEEMIKHFRPGTTKDFTIRTSYLKHFFTT